MRSKDETRANHSSKRDASLETGERLADALVIAAAHAEDPRILRRMSKTSGFSKTDSSWLAELTTGATTQPGHLHPGDLHVPKRLALQGNDRAIEPQALLERIGGQRQVVGEDAHLLGCSSRQSMVNASACVVKSLPAMTQSFMSVSASRSVKWSLPSAAWMR